MRVLPLAVVGLLLWASPALAAGGLVVSGSTAELGESSAITIDLDAGGGGFALFVPDGYSARLDHPPGTVLGKATVSAEVDGGTVELEGEIVAVEPAADPGGTCGQGPHRAVWRIMLGGAVGDVPLAVDAGSDAAAAHASYRIEACPAGARLHRVTLGLKGVFTNPLSVGAYVWRALLTPAGSDTAVESRSTVLLPVALVLHGAYDRGESAAVLTGSLGAGGEPVAGELVAVWANGTRSGSVRTDEDGSFRLTRRVTRATTFRASASVPARDVTSTGCDEPIVPGGCVSATVSPFEVSSDPVRVRPPRAPVLRLGSHGAHVRRLQQDLVRLRYLPPGAVNGVFGERTWHAVVAFQGWQRLVRTGVVNRRTWAALERAGVPQPWGGLRRGVEIDRGRQVLLLVEDGRAVRAIHVSTGAYGRTPAGRFAVYRKEILSWSVPFQAWMPYANYFYGGYAVHGFSSVPAYPASHGCIRVPMVEATVVYGFAGIGTPVWIR